MMGKCVEYICFKENEMSPPSSIINSFDKDAVIAEPGADLKVILVAKLIHLHDNTNIPSCDRIWLSLCVQREQVKIKQAEPFKGRFRGNL